MDSANQIQSLIEEVEKNSEYKINEQEAKGFLSEIKRLTKEDKTNMPPLVVIIMAYINMLFPELDEVKVWRKNTKGKNKSGEKINLFVEQSFFASEEFITRYRSNVSDET